MVAVMFPLNIDMRNPIVHMTLWNLIASSGLLTLLILYTSFSESGREALFATMPYFLFGLAFWLFIALISAFIGGLLIGGLVWMLTFSALVSDKTITRYYISVWIWIGLLLLISNSLIAWWYVSNQQWLYFPLTFEPRTRDVMLVVVWMVVVPLIGATRFVDDLKADPRYLRKRASGEDTI